MKYGMHKYKNTVFVLTKDELKEILRMSPFFALYAVIAWLICRSTCIFKVIFGLPCPGCGLSRSFGAVFRLDFAEALRWHPLFGVIPLVLIAFVIKRLIYGRNIVKWFTAFLFGVTVLFIAVFFTRAIVYFPHTEPFTINRYSFTFRIIDFVKSLF